MTFQLGSILLRLHSRLNLGPAFCLEAETSFNMRGPRHILSSLPWVTSKDPISYNPCRCAACTEEEGISNPNCVYACARPRAKAHGTTSLLLLYIMPLLLLVQKLAKPYVQQELTQHRFHSYHAWNRAL